MFLRAKNRFKDGKEHRYWSIVENRRTSDGRVVQRQVLYLGEINDRQQAAWCRTLGVFDEDRGQATPMALFPEDRPVPVLDCEVIQVRLSGLQVRRPRKWGARTWIVRCSELNTLADEDGIVCIPPVRGEASAAEQLRDILAAAFGNDWSANKERELIAATGSKISDLDDWLRNDFFAHHCALFHQRPFLWHIWDGRKRDGFHAIVNYHKLAEGNGKGRKVMEALTYSYLGDWISRQEQGVRQGEGGAEDRLAAALELKNRLEAILKGEPPFDIFVRWKPIEQQPIGWEPDINDGVRLNIRPFMASDLPSGKRGAGILRDKPNIKWNKDRGKDVVFRLQGRADQRSPPEPRVENPKSDV